MRLLENLLTLPKFNLIFFLIIIIIVDLCYYMFKFNKIESVYFNNLFGNLKLFRYFTDRSCSLNLRYIYS